MKSNYDIIWLECVDSTNDEARRRISDLDNLSVLTATSQTSGRGQRGNVWLSEPGANLLFSIVLKFDGADNGDTRFRSVTPAVQAYDQFVISQIASLSVVDLLAVHDIQARIKWPNDIYVGDRKICGMLIENTVRGKWLSSSIIGIGLNVNQRNFDVNLPNPTSMALCSSEVSSRDPESQEGSSVIQLDQLLEEFMDIFTGYIDRFCHITGGYNRLERLYRAQLWRLDEPSDFIDLTAGATHLDPPAGMTDLPDKATHLDSAAGVTDLPDKATHLPSGTADLSDIGTDVPAGTAEFSDKGNDLPAGAICESPISSAGIPFRGIIRGISPVGHLLVELPDGTTREFAFKEIAYVL